MALAGKEAMKRGSGIFNKEASLLYSKLDSCDKAKFSCSNDDNMVLMGPREVKKAGVRIFAKIQKLVRLFTYHTKYLFLFMSWYFSLMIWRPLVIEDLQLDSMRRIYRLLLRVIVTAV